MSELEREMRDMEERVLAGLRADFVGATAPNPEVTAATIRGEILRRLIEDFIRHYGMTEANAHRAVLALDIEVTWEESEEEGLVFASDVSGEIPASCFPVMRPPV